MYQYIVQDTMTIAGGQIDGMGDVSWVETELHQCRNSLELSMFKPWPPPVPAAGGLMAFSRRWIEQFSFPRAYNEDWMWLINCRSLGARLVRSQARGIHAWSVHKPLNEEQIQREQFGEVLCDGWASAGHDSPEWGGISENLRQTSFWSKILGEETEYFREVMDQLVDETNRRNFQSDSRVIQTLDALRYVLSVMERIRPEGLLGFATKYIESVSTWREIVRKVLDRECGMRS